jgi:hypothetical protein
MKNDTVEQYMKRLNKPFLSKVKEEKRITTIKLFGTVIYEKTEVEEY